MCYCVLRHDGLIVIVGSGNGLLPKAVLTFCQVDYGEADIDSWSEYMDGLVQERCNSSALAIELRLSCTNSSI